MIAVLKLGGSVITDKNVPESFHSELVSGLADEIKDVMESDGFQLILVHGAGSYGHIPAKKYGFDAGKSHDIDKAKKVNDMMDKLSHLVMDKLKESGIKSEVVHPAVMVDGESILSMSLKEIKFSLYSGRVPVIGGLIAEDVSGGYRVLSGDTIVNYLAEVLGADRVIVGSDIDGVYSDNPAENPDAELIPEITKENVDTFNIGGSSGIDVSGGMRKKVDELLELAESGVSSIIINLNEKNRLRNALAGKEVVGTHIVP